MLLESQRLQGGQKKPTQVLRDTGVEVEPGTDFPR